MVVCVAVSELASGVCVAGGGKLVACALREGASWWRVRVSSISTVVARPTIICALVELYVASATFLSSKMGCFARLPRLAQFGALTCCTEHGKRAWGKTGTPMRVFNNSL